MQFNDGIAKFNFDCKAWDDQQLDTIDFYMWMLGYLVPILKKNVKLRRAPAVIVNEKQD